MTEIIPAVLEKTTEDFLQKVSVLPAEAEFVHIDVLENDVWVPIVKEFEVHLMGETPEAQAEKWLDRGAKRIIAHKLLEKMENVEFGLGVELDVPLKEIYPHLDQADFVHLMSIREIGAQGRPFEPEIFDRIKSVREKFPNLPISIDGGVSRDNWKELIDAGADRLIVGSKFKEVWNSQTKK